MDAETLNQAPIVIVGSGLAGYTLARELRKLDTQLPLVLITQDVGDFYSKPMLSNALANGKSPEQLVMTPAATMAAQIDLTLYPQTQVLGVDTQAHRLRTTAGELAYAKLVLALGADPIRLELSGDGASEVLSVNDLSDYARFRQRLTSARRVAILGAGLIGCEFANDLAGAGYEVDVIDPATHPLGRLLPPAAGEVVQQALAEVGVHWHLGTTASAVMRHAQGLRLALADGGELKVDVMLSAVGLRPRIGLAQAAGLTVNRGIVTDRHLQTSASDVYALGDCAEVEGLVLPFVMPLMQSARALAKTLAGNLTAVHYPAMPVVVKTPVIPVVVAPPPNAAGQWRLAATENGVEARFEDVDGALWGFALIGAATAQKNALAKLLPFVLGQPA